MNSNSKKQTKPPVSGFHPEHPAHKKNPKNKYSMNILKSVVGTERAEYAFKTISMGFIPGFHMSNLTIQRTSISLILQIWTRLALRKEKVLSYSSLNKP